MVMRFTLNSFQDIEKLNQEAAKLIGEFEVHSVDGKIMVDAKSLLSLVPLIGQDCYLCVGDDGNYRDLEKLIESVSK